MQKHSLCPWWIGYLLLIPFRKLRHNPEKMIGQYIKPGMKVIDFGSAMGYFSLPIAKMVGNNGKVYCFDIQEKMLTKLVSRAKKAKLENIIEPRHVSKTDAYDGLNQTIDFALLFFVAHEVPDQKMLFKNLSAMLKPGAILYFAEPEGHVKLEDFEKSLEYAEVEGLERKGSTLIANKGYSVIMVKRTI